MVGGKEPNTKCLRKRVVEVFITEKAPRQEELGWYEKQKIAELELQKH